jgi:hypothetical protein
MKKINIHLIRVKCTRLSASHTEERESSQELRTEIFGARRAGDLKWNLSRSISRSRSDSLDYSGKNPSVRSPK